MRAEGTTTDRAKRWLPLVALVFLVGLWAWASPGAAILDAVDRIRDAGALGVVAFATVYLLASLLLLPASWVQGAAGFLYGPLLGIPLASLLSTVSAVGAFFLARTWLRGPVERRWASDVRFRAIDGAVEDGGARLVALLRVSPISPFNIVSYLLGATRVRPRAYALGTWAGGLFPVLLYGWIGSTLEDLAELLDGRAAAQAGHLELVGLFVTLVATLLVTRQARRVLHAALQEAR